MEVILIALLSFLVIALSFILVKVRLDVLKLAKNNLELNFENTMMLEKLVEQQDVINEISFKKNDDFVTFLSESRDWAFSYIEDVQTSITKFVEKVGPVLTYYDKFGRINETPSMNTIFDAYTDLIKVLPENTTQGENNE
jgi:adenylate kinase family enzyme